MEEEVVQQKPKSKIRIIWPWVSLIISLILGLLILDLITFRWIYLLLSLTLSTGALLSFYVIWFGLSIIFGLVSVITGGTMLIRGSERKVLAGVNVVVGVLICSPVLIIIYLIASSGLPI